MGHYVIFDDDNDLKVPSAFIHIILNYLHEVASSEKLLDPLVGEGKYDWNSSLKVLPLCDLDSAGLSCFQIHLCHLLDDLQKISQKWNRPEFQSIFREYAELLLTKIKVKEEESRD